MAWTAPRTWVALENVTATQFNTHLRDNLLYLKSAGYGRAITTASPINFTSNTTDLSAVAVTTRGGVAQVNFAGGRYTNNSGATQSPWLSLYIDAVGQGVATIACGGQPAGVGNGGTAFVTGALNYQTTALSAAAHTFSVREVNGAGDGSGSTYFSGSAFIPLCLTVVELAQS